MFNDDDDDYLDSFLNHPDGPENLYSAEELCQFAFETLEKKHPVKISEIEFAFGGFEFSISADLTKQMTIPNCWQLRSFGDGKLNFFISLEDFQVLYNKLKKGTSKMRSEPLSSACTARSVTSFQSRTPKNLYLKEAWRYWSD